MNRDTIKTFIYIIFTIEIFFCSQCFSSFEDLGVGARFQAMGGTAAAFVNTPDAIFLNCSGLALTKGYEFSFYYSNPFGIKELHLGTLSVAIPFTRGKLGLASKTLGNKLYRENEFILSYANSILKKFHYGFSLRYMRLAISNYGSDFTLGLDIGFIADLNSRMKWGFYSHNINRPNISSKKETLPQIFNTGFNINPIDNIYLNFDIYKDVKFPAELRFGFEYVLLNRLALRSGFVTEPAQFSAGFGVILSVATIDYSFTTHSDLGITHQFSLNISLKQKSFHRKEIVKKRKPKTFKKININTATSEELQQLRGVGPTLASRIIQYREKWGKFNDIGELQNIKGIGEKLFEKIEPYVTVE